MAPCVMVRARAHVGALGLPCTRVVDSANECCYLHCMSDEQDERKGMMIHGVLVRDHHALAAYARVFNLSMGDAFNRAVAGLTGGIDGAEKVIFDRYMADGMKRPGPRPGAKVKPAAEGNE